MVCAEPFFTYRSHASRGLKYAHLNFHQDNVFYGAHQASDGATPTSTATSSNLLPHCRTDGDAGGHPFRARTLSASSTNHHVASDNSLLPSGRVATTATIIITIPWSLSSSALPTTTDFLYSHRDQRRYRRRLLECPVREWYRSTSLLHRPP